MFWLSFLLPIAYIPGVTGAALSTGWAVMSISLPWMRGEPKIPPLVYALASPFLLYVLCLWAASDNKITAVSAVWYLALIGGSFYVGSMLTDLRSVARGLAFGFGISSLLALAQTFGLSTFLEWIPCRPSGLMFNPVILGEGCAITILLLLSYRFYWLALVLVPGLVLSQSRAALLALVVGLTLTYCRPQRSSLWAAPIWLACPLTYTALVAHDTSDDFRWLVWRVLWHFTSFWGHGPGSLDSVIIKFNGHYYAPSYAHNEFLDLTYQYGIGALPAMVLLLLPATAAHRREWPAFMAFLICCLFSFPLHCPPLAFAGAVVAGCLCHDWGLAWHLKHDRRPWPEHWMANEIPSNEAMAV